MSSISPALTNPVIHSRSLIYSPCLIYFPKVKDPTGPRNFLLTLNFPHLLENIQKLKQLKIKKTMVFSATTKQYTATPK